MPIAENRKEAAFLEKYWIDIEKTLYVTDSEMLNHYLEQGWVYLQPFSSDGPDGKTWYGVLLGWPVKK